MSTTYRLRSVVGLLEQMAVSETGIVIDGPAHSVHVIDNDTYDRIKREYFHKKDDFRTPSDDGTRIGFQARGWTWYTKINPPHRRTQ